MTPRLSAAGPLCGVDGLGEEHGDGGWSDAAGHRCDESGSLGGCGVFDVADVAGVVAGVDDDCAGLDPVAFDEFGTADSGDDDVRVTDGAGEIGGFGVAVGDRNVTSSGQWRRFPSIIWRGLMSS
jgi:hypothetical protein